MVIALKLNTSMISFFGNSIENKYFYIQRFLIIGLPLKINIGISSVFGNTIKNKYWYIQLIS